jgi:hypothetical protein
VNRYRLLTAADAEKVLGIPAATVRNWYRHRARTGLLPDGLDRWGKPLFRAEDLKNLRAGRKLRHSDGTRIEHS